MTANVLKTASPVVELVAQTFTLQDVVERDAT